MGPWGKSSWKYAGRKFRPFAPSVVCTPHPPSLPQIPTDAEAPNYSTVVKEPVSINTLRMFLNAGASFQVFQDNLELMWDNAMLYNNEKDRPHNGGVRAAVRLEQGRAGCSTSGTRTGLGNARGVGTNVIKHEGF